MRPFLLAALLASCAAPPDPNVNARVAPPSYAPDPGARSFLGYDPDYERALFNRYLATHQAEIAAFRRAQGW